MLNLKTSGYSRRLAMIFYLASAMFLVAHIVNAFIANELLPPQIGLSDPMPPDSLPTAQRGIAHSLEQGPSTSSSPESPQQHAQAIATSGIFPLPQVSALDTGSGRRTEAPAQPLELAKKVSLLGTAIGGTSGGAAIIEDLATKEQKLVRLHHSLPNIGELAAVEKDRALFRLGNQEEWITSGAATAMANSPRFPLLILASSGSELSPQPVARMASERRFLKRQDLLKWQPRVYGDRIVPYVERGKAVGVQIQLAPNGFFHQIGLETNDVLRRINGVEILDRGFLLQTTLPQLKKKPRITLDFTRNGEPRTLSYVVE